MKIGGKLARPPLINKLDPIRSFGKAVETGVKMFGAAKGAWDFGRSAVAAGRVVAPYVAAGIRTLALA